MTPNLGQGACQAIEDAVVLAGCVRERRNGDDVAGALRLYEERRKRQTAMVVRRSRMMGRIGQLENGLLRALRDRVVRAMPLGARVRQLEPILGYEV